METQPSTEMYATIQRKIQQLRSAIVHFDAFYMPHKPTNEIFFGCESNDIVTETVKN